MPGNPLHAEVTADSGDFVASVETAVQSGERLGDQAIDTSGSLQVLQNRADEAGDQVRGAGRSATVASAQFGGLTLSSMSLTNALGVLGATATGTTATLAVLGTTLLPLVAVVGTLAAGIASLAAVFGGFAAIGAVTHMEELKNAFAEAADEIMTLLQPLGEVFGPLLVGAVEALPTLVERILETIGPVEEFRDAFVEFGQLAMEIIPQIVGGMVEFARMALPPFRQFVDYLLGNGQGAMEGMLAVTEELAPELQRFGQAVIDALPELTELGVIILEGLLPALTSTIELTEDVVGSFNNFVRSSEELQEATAAYVEHLRAGASAIETFVAGTEDGSEASAAFSDEILALRERVGQSLAGLSSLFDRHLGDIAMQTQAILDSVIGFWRRHSDTIETLVRSAWNIVDSVVIGTLDGILSTVNILLAALRGDWDQAWQELTGILRRQFDRAVTIVQNVGPLLRSAAEMTVNGIVVAFEHMLGIVVTNSDSLIKSLFRSARDWIVSSGSGTLTGAFDTAVSAVQDAVSWLTGTGEDSLVGEMLDAFDGLAGSLASLFTDAFSGLQSTVNDALGLPWTVGIPSVTVAGETIGGGEITIGRFGGSSSSSNGWESSETSSAASESPTGGSSAQRSSGGMAEGGIATQPTISALAEEGTPEAVIPFDKMGQFLGMAGGGGASAAELASAINDALAGMPISLSGQLEVDGDVATLEDVDARIQRQRDLAKNRGLRGGTRQ